MNAVVAGCNNPYAYFLADTAMSDEASYLRRTTAEDIEETEQSWALFEKKSKVIRDIRGLYEECFDANWDGYGAVGVSRSAMLRAIAIIFRLPDVIPMPEVSAEPDGAISLDWEVARNRVFSISISGDDRLSYAWLDRGERGHGVATLNSGGIPTRIIKTIKEITGHRGVTVRIA
jgi:hypothetical protein